MIVIQIRQSLDFFLIRGDPMDEMTILGKVYYKQIVTNSYKARAKAEIQKQIEDINDQLAVFDKQMSKTMTELTLKAHPQTEALRQQFNAERDKIAAYKTQFETAIQAVDALEDGKEVDAGDGEFLTQVHVGDAFEGSLNYELIIKDDIIQEIRKK
jgi:hypothetical protein